jgi:hypothetical protein
MSEATIGPRQLHGGGFAFRNHQGFYHIGSFPVKSSVVKAVKGLVR